MTQPRAITSFEKSRKVLLTQMTAKAKGEVKEAVIGFRNDDVPKFLRQLNKFEKQSRKSSITIK
jgi:hypothetical protein